MEFRLPELGEGVYEAEFVDWLVKPGETVRLGQTLAEVMTDKATMEVPSPFRGTITRLHVGSGQDIKIGDVILTYETTETGAPSHAEIKNDEPQAKAKGKKAGRTNGRQATEVSRPAARVSAAPSVRRRARQLGVDLSKVTGTGPSGRILNDDVTRFAEASAAGSNAVEPDEATAGALAQPASSPAEYRPGARIKLQGLRRRIAEQMVRSRQAIPHYSYIDECNVTQLVGLRNSLKETLAKSGVKLTYLAFVVKAVSRALKEIPLVNSTLDEDCGEIVLHDHYHIGVAVATPAGLVVPVIRDADRKDLTAIALEIDRLSGAAREGKQRLENLQGGTFTITSIGSIGGLISTPIINYPQVAILGTGKIVRRPMYDQTGSIAPADLMYLSFSFDHRVLDGDIGARFSNAIIRQLENPATLLLPDRLV